MTEAVPGVSEWPPDPEALRSQLPNRGRAVTPEEAIGRVEHWKNLLEYQPQSVREYALASGIVTLGAKGELEAIAQKRSGHAETPGADAMVRMARDDLAAYNGRKETPGDPGDSGNTAYFGRLTW